MPVTIKKSQLMYKNESTGEYVSVDAVADKTSQQQINGINTAASNAIASINTAMQDIDTQPLTTLPKKVYKKDIAANEETLASAATHAYTIGDYFYVADNNNDKSLYKATAAIAVGNTISPGTGIDNNCIPAALADDVTSLSNDLSKINDLYNVNIFTEYIYDTLPDTFNISNKIFFTKVGHGGLKVECNEEESVPSGYYNIFNGAPPSWFDENATYTFFTNYDHIIRIEWFYMQNNSIKRSLYSHSEHVSGKFDVEYNKFILRFYNINEHVSYPYSFIMYPSIYKNINYNLLDSNSSNNFKYINYLDIKSKYDEIDFNEFTSIGYYLISSGTDEEKIYNAPVSAIFKNSISKKATLLKVFKAYGFMIQEMSFLSDIYKARRYFSKSSNNWSVWVDETPVFPTTLAAFKSELKEKDSTMIFKSISIANCDKGNYINIVNNEYVTEENETFSIYYYPLENLGFIPRYGINSAVITNLFLCDNEKNVLSHIVGSHTSFTNEYSDLTSTQTAYVYNLTNVDWTNVKYLGIISAYKSDVANNLSNYDVLTFSTHLKFIMPGRCMYEEDELIFYNGKIMNKIPNYEIHYDELVNEMASFPMNNNYYKYKYGNISTNKSSNFISTPTMFIPAGTRINCLPSAAMYLSIRGCDCTGSMYISYAHFGTWDGYIVPRDIYGSLCATFDTWNHWNDKFDMNYLSKIQKFFNFITLQSPEELENNPWKNKHWYAYGTSITDIGLKDTAGNSGHSGKYPLYLDMHSDMIRHNGAIGSGGILNKDANNGRLNVKKNILATPSNADLVTLEILPNDSYYVDASLGTIDDTSNATILGNLNQCLDYLVNNTHARIVFIFVTTSSAPNNIQSHNTNEPMYDSLSSTRKKYRAAVNKVKELAELYGCYCIDVDRDLYPYEMRNWGNLFADWIHPSYLGGWLIGKYVWKKLKEIGPMPIFPDIEQEKSTMEWSNYTSPQE